MFSRMMASVRREWSISQGSFARSSVMSAMSAVSIAASLPAAPIAMPRLARAMAGASLTPSPTMATVPYFATSSSTALTLSSGSSSAWTSSMPTWRAIASAVARLSPVSMIRCSTPRARRSPITPAASGRTVSATAIRPQTCRSLPITTTVRPACSSAAARSTTSLVSWPRSTR